jgi:hypothetical protein
MLFPGRNKKENPVPNKIEKIPFSITANVWLNYPELQKGLSGLLE